MIRVGIKGKLVHRRGKLVKVLMRVVQEVKGKCLIQMVRKDVEHIRIR